MGDAGDAGLALGPEPDEQRRALRIEGATLGAADPLRGFWAGADWIWHQDGKYRPVEPGTFPLATRYSSRVGQLRTYGNALCLPQAVAFVRATLGVI